MLPLSPTAGRRAFLTTASLATIALVLPTLLARSGPDSVRRWLRGLQHGSIQGLGLGQRFLQFATQHRVLGEVSGPRIIEFEFHNRGAGPVRFVRTWVSCACLRVEVPSQPVAAGAAGKILVHFDTQDQLSGAVWLMAKVFTDVEPDQPFLLAAEGEVR